MQLVEPHKFNEPIRVNENITVTLVPNGHLIGAASALVQIHCPGEKKDINIFFTGDYNNKNLFFEVSPLRKWITELPLTIVTESTYGTMNSSDISYVFEGNILRALEEGKTIVIPVFSLGRAQEILYYLKDMQARNSELFKNVPIYYDGKLSFYYTGMYNVIAEKEIVKFFDDKKDFLPLNLEKIEDKLLRRGIVADESCKIIVTTSGMGSYGPAQTYIPAFINKSNALIHFTGYCSEGTLGYNLKFTEKGEIVEVGGVQTVKRADVEFTNEFSAHAKADELIALISSFKNAQFAVVNHGRDDVKEAFAKRILKELDLEHVGILGREYFYRIDQNGFVKGYATKFL